MAADVSARNLARTAAASAPLAALSLALVAFLPQELTRSHGLGLAEAGIAFMIIRLLDIAIDPYLGNLIDRTRARLGGYKVWLLGGSVPIIIGVALGFFPPDRVGIVYLLISLAAAYVGFSIVTLAHLALCAGQSEDYNARGKVFAWWQAYATIGILAAMLVPKLMQGTFGFGVLQWMGLTVIALFVVAIPVTALLGREGPSRTAAHGGGLKAYFSLFTLASTRRVMALELFLGLAAGISAAGGLIFMTAVKGFTVADYGTQISVYFLVSICSAPIWAWVATKMEKQNALRFATVCYVLSVLMYYLTPPGDLMFMLIFPALFGGFAFTATNMLPRAMLADVADEERLRSGGDRTALLYALLTGIFKMGHALSVGIAFFVLNLFGYVPALGSANTPEALTGVNVVFIALTMASAVIAGLLTIGYPLNRARHTVIRRKLEEQGLQARPADAADLPPVAAPI